MKLIISGILLFNCIKNFIIKIFDNKHSTSFQPPRLPAPYNLLYIVSESDIELKKYFKTNIIWLLDMSF